MEEKKEKIIKVQSVAAARRRAAEDKNNFIKKWGMANWSAAILTAYQGGSYRELQANLDIPAKWLRLLLDAYQYKATEEELRMARAAVAPYLKKKASKDYFEGLTDYLEGKKK